MNHTILRSKLTAKAIQDAPGGIITYSERGHRFNINTKHSHWATYECHNVTQGTTYYVNSIGEVKEWLSLN